ncbi:MAG: type I 3-dehydroquinate dehydratase [Eubacteriales bacterium]
MSFTIKNLDIGKGRTKICIPLIASTLEEIKIQLNEILSLPCDIIEWRCDAFNDFKNKNKLSCALKVLESKCKNIPLLFTLRTSNEGGMANISQDSYCEICFSAIDSAIPDLIDIEISCEKAQNIINYAHKKSIKTIISHHNFNNTPPKTEILKLLKKMYDTNADILKIAVMPHCISDVSTLIFVTSEMKIWQQQYRVNDIRPIVAISMGEIGKITRIAGDTFESAITFATARKYSAPGQIKAENLQKIFELLE